MKLKASLTRFLSIMAAVVVSTAAVYARPAAETPAERADSVNRAVAVVMAGSLNSVLDNLVSTGLPIDRSEVGKYIAEALAGRDFGMTSEQANAYVESVLRQGTQLTVESQNAFIEEASKWPGAIVTPSGLVFQVITEGEGVNPADGDRVQVRYF